MVFSDEHNADNMMRSIIVLSILLLLVASDRVDVIWKDQRMYYHADHGHVCYCNVGWRHQFLPVLLNVYGMVFFYLVLCNFF